MKSVADTIHDHVNRTSINEVEPVLNDKIDMFFISLANMNQITMQEVDKVEKLKPVYAEMVREKEIELGISFKLWNTRIIEELDKRFMERYLR